MRYCSPSITNMQQSRSPGIPTPVVGGGVLGSASRRLRGPRKSEHRSNWASSQHARANTRIFWTSVERICSSGLNFRVSVVSRSVFQVFPLSVMQFNVEDCYCHLVPLTQPSITFSSPFATGLPSRFSPWIPFQGKQEATTAFLKK